MIPQGAADKPAVFVEIPKTGTQSTQWLFSVQRIDKNGPVSALRGRHRYFTFSIVRNPWDRMHSMWYYYCIFKASRPGWQDITFAQWCLDKGRPNPDHPLSAGRPRDPCRFPQFKWLQVSGRLAVDKVYRFESLQECWDDLAARGYHRRQRHTHRNRRPNKPDWRSAYTPKLVERVAQLFAKDIEAFGYTFP